MKFKNVLLKGHWTVKELNEIFESNGEFTQFNYYLYIGINKNH